MRDRAVDQAQRVMSRPSIADGRPRQKCVRDRKKLRKMYGLNPVSSMSRMLELV